MKLAACFLTLLPGFAVAKTAIEAAESPAMGSMIFKYDFLLFIVQF